MAFIDWNSNLSVGVEAIDDQHKKLIGLVNDLFDAMSDGKGNETLSYIFVELVEYTKTHFSYEESLMNKHPYENKEFHLNEHKGLTEQVIDLHTKFKSGQATITVPVLNFLRSWLNNHILETDKRYGAYLNSVGVN